MARGHIAWAAVLSLMACVPNTPQTRRAAYLDCARDQGVAVSDGAIRTTSAADLAKLDACKAIPR
ncbi:MAG: hypothetical protein WBA67_15595 [Jannaschia sp.]